MKIDALCTTDGKGLWSDEVRAVKLTRMFVRDIYGNTGELRVYFDEKTWDTQKHGLIYTDNRWMKEFREALKRMGFSWQATHDVSYSEQGMQGADYVSCDVGPVFIEEFSTLHGD